MKEVKTYFENNCGKMDLKIKGKNAIVLSMKIMKTFDNACKELKEKELTP